MDILPVIAAFTAELFLQMAAGIIGLLGIINSETIAGEWYWFMYLILVLSISLA